MKTKILYIERKPYESVSIERVFGQIASKLSKKLYDVSFEQLPYSHDTISTIKNLIFYRHSKADIYHVTGHIHYIALILPKKNTVLTVHDLRILYIRKGLRRFILKKLFFDLPFKRLKYITAISEATKQEIIFFTNCPADKIQVIENPLPVEPIAEKKKEFNKQCPRILQIGTTSNKNIKNLIKALKGINCQLVIIGKLDEEAQHLLSENEINFENKLVLGDLEIRNEYEKADIVTFCSTYEGFGLPIIEAQAMRTPVVTSNLSPMREVAGDAAVLVEPDDIQCIRNGILQVIENKIIRADLVEKGINNIKRFESKTIAEKYEKLYREVEINENLH